MKTFAFIFFPQTIKQLQCLLPWRKIIPGFFSKSYLKNLAPFKISCIKKIRSIQEKEIQGYLIACPLISQSEDGLAQEAILERFAQAAGIAVKLGADILGLDINLPAINIKNKDLTEARLKIPLTNGYTLTAWSIFEAVYRTAKFKNLDFKNSSLVIAADNNAIRALCAEKLYTYFTKIAAGSDYKTQAELAKAISEADILIYLNDTPGFLSNIIKELKSGAVLFVARLAKNTIAKLNSLRRDITIIRAGLVKLPFPVNPGINPGFSGQIVSAGMAETMLMAFEDKVPGYSLSGDGNVEKLEELADISVQHGFEVWVPEAPVL